MKFTLSFILCVLLFSARVYAGEPSKATVKTVMIKGKIQDSKNNESLAGVKIECAGCQKVIYSDLDGNFFMYLQVDAKQDVKLEFTQVGYASKTLSLQDLSSGSTNTVIDLESE